MRITTDVFIERATKKHGTKFDYSNAVYVDSKTDVQIHCTKHGINFWQRPDTHWSGAECPKCGYEKTARKNSENFKFTTEEFIKKAIEVHGDKYNYSKVEYKLNSIPVTITCPIHGDFEQRPNDHTSGQKGCKHCSKTGFDMNKPAILYYLSINNGQAYKIGITNRSVKDRYNNIDLDKIRVLKIWEYPLGKYAHKVEQDILKLYVNNKYNGAPILQTGNSELFIDDVLELDTIN